MNDARRIDTLMQAGLAAVLAAAPIALQYFREPLQVEDKRLHGAFDPVTQADKQVEQAIAAALRAHDATLAIVGEEFGRSGQGDDYWIVDPIDGTRAFMSGMPTWGILLGLVIDGRPVGSVMHQPFTGETLFADSAGGRFMHRGQSRPLRTSDCAELGNAILYSTDPAMIDRADLNRPFEALRRRVMLPRWGGDCYGFALLAQGCIDLMVEGSLQPYDIVPLVRAIEAAGGVVTDLQSRLPLNGGNVIAAANPRLHAQALAILNDPTLKE
jgi:myo-inositol-1(or 4)-monophosphatase